MKKCGIQNKIMYQTKPQAEQAMFSFYRDTGAQAFGSYQCRHCHYWHITHQYDNRSDFIRRKIKRYKKQQNIREYRKNEVTLSRQKQKELIAQLNNKPASLIHRIAVALKEYMV